MPPKINVKVMSGSCKMSGLWVMCTKCVMIRYNAMIRCATMQSALLGYLSSKYYYSILSMMMMPKEGMVCFIVFFDNKNIWFREKIKSLSQLLRKL